MPIAWPTFVLVWVVVGVAGVLVRAAGSLVAGHAPTFASAMTDLTLIAIWAVASPFVFVSAKRFPVSRARPMPNALLHFALGTAFIVGSNVVIRLPMLWRVGVRGLFVDAGIGIATYYPGAIVMYVALVAIGQYLARQRDIEGAQLSTEAPAGFVAHAGVESITAAHTKETGDEATIDRLVIREWNRVHLIALDDIEWIEAANNHVVVHAAARTYKGRERISDVEARLDERRFVRVHRSAIVHLEKIREVQPLARGDHAIVLKSGCVVRVARTRKQILESALGVAL